MYSGFVEAFPVKDKSADNICHLIINEIFPRYGTLLQLLTDNGTENINRKVSETLKALNISHVKTSFYHPQSNGKIERFHRVLADVMSKKLQRDGHYAWDLYLNQTLAARRFSISDATNQSPFFLLYNRDVVLPLDNILKPRVKYQGEDMHQISLEIQHESFMEVHRNLKKAQKTQAFYTDRKAKPVTLQIGDPVYYKNFNKKNKLDVRWKPYYRIIEKTSEVTFKIKNQLDGTTTKAHAEQLRLAKIDEWEIPKNDDGHRLRRARYVVPLESESDTENERATSDSNTSQENPDPLTKLASKYRNQRTDSSSESDIPLMELQSRIRKQERRVKRQNDSLASDSETELITPPEVSENESENETKMSIDALNKIKRPKRRKRSNMEKLNMVNRIFQIVSKL